MNDRFAKLVALAVECPDGQVLRESVAELVRNPGEDPEQWCAGLLCAQMWIPWAKYVRDAPPRTVRVGELFRDGWFPKVVFHLEALVRCWETWGLSPDHRDWLETVVELLWGIVARQRVSVTAVADELVACGLLASALRDDLSGPLLATVQDEKVRQHPLYRRLSREDHLGAFVDALRSEAVVVELPRARARYRDRGS